MAHVAAEARAEDVEVRPLEPLAVVGSATLRVVHGRVRCLGFELRAGADPVTVHSPAGGLTAVLHTPTAVSSTARVQVRQLPSQAPVGDRAGKRRRSEQLHGFATAAIAAPAQSAREAAHDDELGDAEEEGQADDDEKDDGDGAAAAAVPSDAAASSMRLLLRPLPPGASVSRSLGALVPSEWDAAVDALATIMASPPASPSAVVLLCGARNVGKSALARLLVNRALASGAPEVALLDCDVGQPELSPPGLVALHAVTRPLLGPPHTQLRAPRRCRFVGHATPGEAPAEYLACVTALLAEHRAAHGRAADGAAPPLPPLVVNTCGWVSGLGLQLLADITAA